MFYFDRRKAPEVAYHSMAKLLGQRHCCRPLSFTQHEKKTHDIIKKGPVTCEYVQKCL